VTFENEEKMPKTKIQMSIEGQHQLKKAEYHHLAFFIEHLTFMDALIPGRKAIWKSKCGNHCNLNVAT
jgi:hypothetical protein